MLRIPNPTQVRISPKLWQLLPRISGTIPWDPGAENAVNTEHAGKWAEKKQMDTYT